MVHVKRREGVIELEDLIIRTVAVAVINTITGALVNCLIDGVKERRRARRKGPRSPKHLRP